MNLYVLVIISLFSAQVFSSSDEDCGFGRGGPSAACRSLHITRDMGGRVRASKIRLYNQDSKNLRIEDISDELGLEVEIVRRTLSYQQVAAHEELASLLDKTVNKSNFSRLIKQALTKGIIDESRKNMLEIHNAWGNCAKHVF